jgi:sterol 24-C-methyltransferase
LLLACLPVNPCSHYVFLLARPSDSNADFRTTKVGRYATHYLVKTLERFGVAPKGSLEVASMLERAADGLVAGGKMGLFTPLFFFLVRKPESAK